MHVTDVLSALIVGLIVGVLGRLLLPGKQDIGAFLTLVIGVVSALLGGWVANVLSIGDRAPMHVGPVHWDWIVLAIQLGFAIIAIALAAMVARSRVTTDAPRKRARARRR
jgi:uncharacterized membrane protein YeaQ/YmgE (transglycosylase-associated protein family)